MFAFESCATFGAPGVEATPAQFVMTDNGLRAVCTVRPAGTDRRIMVIADTPRSIEKKIVEYSAALAAANA